MVQADNNKENNVEVVGETNRNIIMMTKAVILDNDYFKIFQILICVSINADDVWLLKVFWKSFSPVFSAVLS